MIEEVKKILMEAGVYKKILHRDFRDIERTSLATKIHQLYTKPDRPELREKIADFIYTICEGRILPELQTLAEEDKISYYNKADQILALLPDIEEADIVGRFLERGWIPPEEANQKVGELFEGTK